MAYHCCTEFSIMNKFDRVISTLILLQTKRVIKAKEIADRYDISLRTVYRDISTLRNAGVPIIGDPGIGYSIMDGYRLPPVSFSQKEAAALLTAEKFIGKVTDKETEANYLNAMAKIKAILRNTEKQSLAILDDSIAISDFQSPENKMYLQDLLKSIASRKIVEISYLKANGTSSNRKIEPIGCYHQFNNWYLFAYCQKQNDYRTFKINRIVTLLILEQTFEPKHINLQNYLNRQRTKQEDDQFYEITIAFDRTFVHFAEMRKHYFGFVEQKEEPNTVTMTFLYPSIEIIARWLLQFGANATVLAPSELENLMKTLAEALHSHYFKNNLAPKN